MSDKKLNLKDCEQYVDAALEQEKRFKRLRDLALRSTTIDPWKFSEIVSTMERSDIQYLLLAVGVARATIQDQEIGRLLFPVMMVEMLN